MSDEKNFTYVDSCDVEHSIQISPEDLKLTQVDKEIHDTKFQSKPTTFFKDALRRFVKNKSSVAGAIVLGTIILGCIFIPILDPSDVDHVHQYEKHLEPKLFDAGTGWWDGCRHYDNITVDFDWEQFEKDGSYVGFPADVNKAAVVGGQAGVHMSKVGENKVDAYNPYGHGGFMRVANDKSSTEAARLYSYPVDMDIEKYDLSLAVKTSALPEDFTYGEQGSFAYFITTALGEVQLTDYSTNTGALSFKLSDNANLISMAATNGGVLPSARFELRIKNKTGATLNQNVLLQSVVFSSEAAAKDNSTEANEYVSNLNNASFKDANKAAGITPSTTTGETNKWYWTCPNGTREVYQADLVVCSYSFDTYEDAFGYRYNYGFSMSAIKNYIKKGWLNAEYSVAKLQAARYSEQACADFLAGLSMTSEGDKYCPLRLEDATPYFTAVGGGGASVVTLVGTCSFWRYLGYSSCPRYLVGTDDSGRDLLDYSFSGLRTSLLLGLVTFVVNFVFGLVWGAISGYFGGWTDILMERFTDILSGIPWIVVMTLTIILLGQNFFVFALALCLTGWIGTSHLTRTQFYRFKSREYILAARTLGASDKRLIFRHILPNAIGTIITSSVLMIPSVIFSEATISYLNLGLQGMASFGVILSENQKFLQIYPYLIVFPSVIMALMMISFNLFGNGLRDAFNPSLKGQD